MTGHLVPVAEYCTNAEAAGTSQALANCRVAALVKSCGPARFPFGEGMDFQLLVQEKELAWAISVYALFSEKHAQNRETPLPAP